MSIQQKDWVIGEVYHDETTSRQHTYLFLWNGKECSPSLQFETKRYSKDTRNFRDSCENDRVRAATPSEKAWLLKCIEADKYLPFEEIVTEPFYLSYP